MDSGRRKHAGKACTDWQYQGKWADAVKLNGGVCCGNDKPTTKRPKINRGAGIPPISFGRVENGLGTPTAGWDEWIRKVLRGSCARPSVSGFFIIGCVPSALGVCFMAEKFSAYIYRKQGKKATSDYSWRRSLQQKVQFYPHIYTEKQKQKNTEVKPSVLWIKAFS